MRPRVAAIVPAAGHGARLGMKTRKPFVLLKGRELVTYTLAALERSPAIDAIVIAAEKMYVGRLRALVKKYKFRKVAAVIAGGKTRFESVRNCLDAIGSSFDIILIHDGARPLVTDSLITGSIRLASRHGACIVAVPESDTVKLVSKGLFIRKTLDRRSIFRAQTPQTFRRSVLMRAFGRTKHKDRVTDDASLIEMSGGKVKILAGSYRNIKITTKEDLKLAEVLI